MKSRSFIKGSLAFGLALSMAVSGTGVSNMGTVSAAAKVKLSKSKVTVTKGDTTTLTVKKTKKKVKWSVKKKKIAKVVKVSGKKKEVATIKGLKPGKTVVTAKVGKKKLTCKVKVKKPVDNFKSIKMDTYDSKCVILNLKKADSKLKEADIKVTTKNEKAGKYNTQIDVQKLVKVSNKQYRVYLSGSVGNGRYVNLKSGVSTADTQEKRTFYAEADTVTLVYQKGTKVSVCPAQWFGNAIGSVKVSLKKGETLPDGLQMDQKYCLIKGIASTAGTKAVTVVATDEMGRTAEKKVTFAVYDETALAVANQENEIKWDQSISDEAASYTEYNKTALDQDKKYLKRYEIAPKGGSGVYTFKLDAGDCPDARLDTDDISNDSAKTVTSRNATSTKLCIPYTIAAGVHTFTVTATDVMDANRTCVSTITVTVTPSYNVSGAVKSTNGQKITSGKVYLIPKGANTIEDAYVSQFETTGDTKSADIGRYTVDVPEGQYSVKVQGDVLYQMNGAIKVGKENKVAQVTVPEKFYAVSGKATYSDANNELRNKTLYFETKSKKYEGTAAYTVETDKYGAFSLSLPSNSYAVYFKDEKGNRKYFAGSLVVKDKDQVVTLKSSLARYKVEGIVYNGTSKDAASQMFDTIKDVDLYFYNAQGICTKTETDEKGAYKVFLEGGNTYVVRADFAGVLRTVGTVAVEAQNMTGANITYASTKDTFTNGATEYAVDKLGQVSTLLSTGANDIIWKFTPTEAATYVFDIDTALECGAKVYLLDENLQKLYSVDIAGKKDEESGATAEPTATATTQPAQSYDFGCTLEPGKIYFIQVMPKAANSEIGQGQGNVTLKIEKKVVTPTVSPSVTVRPTVPPRPSATPSANGNR